MSSPLSAPPSAPPSAGQGAEAQLEGYGATGASGQDDVYAFERRMREGEEGGHAETRRRRQYSPKQHKGSSPPRREAQRAPFYANPFARQEQQFGARRGLREEERERQRKEREERLAQGFAVEKPKLRALESAEEILQKVKTGGVYIPPFKLRRVQEKVQDKKSAEYQRMNWDALRKSINGLINKVNVSNTKNLIPELFSENLVRGRGLFARAILKAQGASPSFTHVYAALIAVVNTKMPEIGELVLKRLIVAFRKAYKRNDKIRCIACCKFIAHMVNQQVVTEILAGQILGLLLEKPTDDSVELAVGFIKECGQVLSNIAPKIVHALFDRLRSILHEGEIDKRVQYMIENLFTIRKTEFKEFPGVIQDLDLVEEEDQITHELELDDEINVDNQLDYFHFDDEFELNEERYQQIKREILGEQTEQEQKSDDSDSDSDEEDGAIKTMEVKPLTEKSEDQTQQDMITFKRTVYLTIMSSIDFQECCHKLLKSGLCEGKEMEVCSMIIECCSQDRSYQRYFGLLAQRFCLIDRIYQQKFEECFAIHYGMIHRLETNKIRNVGKLFAHLLSTDSISWSVMETISLTQNDTTSSSRIFIKILFQELSEHMSLQKLNDRLKDPFLKDHFAGMFPRSNPKDTRFSINFWTSIGLGALTEELREHLKVASQMALEAASKRQDSDESSSSSDDYSSSSDDSSDDENLKKRKKKKEKQSKRSPSREDKKNDKRQLPTGEEKPRDQHHKDKKEDTPLLSLPKKVELAQPMQKQPSPLREAPKESSTKSSSSSRPYSSHSERRDRYSSDSDDERRRRRRRRRRSDSRERYHHSYSHGDHDRHRSRNYHSSRRRSSSRERY